ncbi:MAG: ABC transporter ATP-binding protein [Polyangiaceae bacterium]
MISVRHLVKRYGTHLAVDDVSFEVEKGEIVGFLGPNGAGKSTTLRILSGFLGPSKGVVKVAGHDIERDAFEARKSIGYMPEAVPLYPEMRVAEYLAFRAELKNVPRAKRRAHIDDAMEKAGVHEVATTLIGRLSKGYKQRVGLADALVARPPILILDEPTAGLDPNQIREVRSVIRNLGDEHTVLLSTHILSEVEASCSKVILIAKGKLLAQGKTDDIRAMLHGAGVEITVRGDRELASKTLTEKAGAASVSNITASEAPEGVSTLLVSWEKQAESATAIENAIAALVEAGLFVREAKSIGSTLEEVFATLTAEKEKTKTETKKKKEGKK